MPTRKPSVADPVDAWVRLEILVPGSWKRWLEDASRVRATSVSALVRSLIRDLMIRRHQNGGDDT
jgi:hypothetical protein